MSAPWPVWRAQRRVLLLHIVVLWVEGRKSCSARPHVWYYLQVAFIVSEQDLRDAIFLDYLNQLISTGHIPGLYTRAELESIFTELRQILSRDNPGTSTMNMDTECLLNLIIAVKSWASVWSIYSIRTGENHTIFQMLRCNGCFAIVGFKDDSLQVHSFFIQRLRNNLHVLLCMSPVGNLFSQQLQRFPAFLQDMTIDWFLSWPVDALTEVAGTYLDRHGANIKVCHC